MIIFKNIPGYRGLYQATSEGRIWSVLSNQYITPNAKGDGYVMAILWKKGKKRKFRWHIVIAKLFVPNPKRKPDVNHDDGDRANCHPSNLTWMTKKENHIHRHNTLGSNNLGIKHTPITIKKDCGSEITYSTVSEAARTLKLSRHHVLRMGTFVLTKL